MKYIAVLVSSTLGLWYTVVMVFSSIEQFIFIVVQLALSQKLRALVGCHKVAQHSLLSFACVFYQQSYPFLGNQHLFSPLGRRAYLSTNFVKLTTS
jgi:hypothetical protein